ncbi:MAG TPA: hypothetical protein VLF66_11170 [Thermoanaerobaculia bacterium]|nr:hypothetical protein [Thermoanaerobaculia bacterium]
MTPAPRGTALLLILLALTAPAFSARAQEPPSEVPAEPAAVAAELRRLNGTLARIVELLEDQLEGQRLDLRLKRLEAAARRVDALDGELARAKSGRTSLADERFHMQSRMESMVTEVDRADPEALPAYEAMTQQAERFLAHLETRIAEHDARILDLENELARRRADLQALEDRLDRELEGLE